MPRARHRLEQRRIDFPWHVLLAVEYGRSMKKLMVRNSLDVSLSSLSLLSGVPKTDKLKVKDHTFRIDLPGLRNGAFRLAR
jgi:hypothetical protein